MATLIVTGVITGVCGVLCGIGYKEELKQIEQDKVAKAA